MLHENWNRDPTERTLTVLDRYHAFHRLVNPVTSGGPPTGQWKICHKYGSEQWKQMVREEDSSTPEPIQLSTDQFVMNPETYVNWKVIAWTSRSKMKSRKHGTTVVFVPDFIGPDVHQLYTDSIFPVLFQLVNIPGTPDLRGTIPSDRYRLALMGDCEPSIGWQYRKGIQLVLTNTDNIQLLWCTFTDGERTFKMQSHPAQLSVWCFITERTEPDNRGGRGRYKEMAADIAQVVTYHTMNLIMEAVIGLYIGGHVNANSEKLQANIYCDNESYKFSLDYHYRLYGDRVNSPLCPRYGFWVSMDGLLAVNDIQIRHSNPSQPSEYDKLLAEKELFELDFDENEKFESEEHKKEESEQRKRLKERIEEMHSNFNREPVDQWSEEERNPIQIDHEGRDVTEKLKDKQKWIKEKVEERKRLREALRSSEQTFCSLLKENTFVIHDELFVFVHNYNRLDCVRYGDRDQFTEFYFPDFNWPQPYSPKVLIIAEGVNLLNVKEKYPPSLGPDKYWKTSDLYRSDPRLTTELVIDWFELEEKFKPGSTNRKRMSQVLRREDIPDSQSVRMPEGAGPANSWLAIGLVSPAQFVVGDGQIWLIEMVNVWMQMGANASPFRRKHSYVCTLIVRYVYVLATQRGHVLYYMVNDGYNLFGPDLSNTGDANDHQYTEQYRQCVNFFTTRSIYIPPNWTPQSPIPEHLRPVVSMLTELQDDTTRMRPRGYNYQHRETRLTKIGQQLGLNLLSFRF